MLLVILLFLAVPTVDALSQSGSSSNNNLPKTPSDRVLSPEFYKSVYKNIDTNDDQRNNAVAIGNDAATYDDDDDVDTTARIGGRTPWDIGNNRPQPAIKRAYEEGKIRGNVLDAGCGVGENCIFLANRYGIQSIAGFDLSEDAVQIAANAVEGLLEDQEGPSPFWTTPKFFAASCTEVADRHRAELLSNIVQTEDGANGSSSNDKSLFDVVIDSGLLHCLSKEDAAEYANQIYKLLLPNTGRFYIGCFSTANPDPWDNPRRISEEYLRNELFSDRKKWEVLACRDCWWARPPTRGSSTGGAFSLALWVEVRCLGPGEND